MSSFNLEITIGGLCVLVPELDTAGQPKSLHVLMPKTPPNGPHKHQPWLFFLKRYIDPSAGATQSEEINLAGRELDLSTLSSGTPLDLRLSPEVFDFDHQKVVTKRRVDRALLGWPGLPPLLNSRMRVNTGAEIPGRALPGGIWMLENVPFQMATAVVWGLRNVPGTELKLDLFPTPLKPIDEGAGPAIRLFLLHVTDKEKLPSIPDTLPGPTWVPKPPYEAEHFHHKYPLLKPAQPGLNPWFVGLPGTLALSAAPGRHHASFRMSALNFGSELTCMVSTTKPG